ncbi:MAG: hypothetical protein HWQ43_24650 [Nostoc sp. JL31]|uniref:hypothetical protein n=1 Tax=Nostoc sp. JL31 TaxID=2815395 RepID=UPI0025F3A185|nr:hypothetical protein [Nostoc sp. JL31]MBN3892198.1 hypothetical protein [Nostoc sp. JL31]
MFQRIDFRKLLVIFCLQLGKSIPVNYRIYNKQDGQTKNDYLRDMITEVLAWGLEPHVVTTDAWYSSKKT